MTLSGENEVGNFKYLLILVCDNYRQSVAVFLTRGDLWINWEHGRDMFEHLMLDAERSVNSGSWMRNSCSAFITSPIEHYCPVTYGQKVDPEGVYAKTYIPELRHYPKEYIYCPWYAPKHLQMKYGCVIGVDYPSPVVNHITAGIVCFERLNRVMVAIQSSQ